MQKITDLKDPISYFLLSTLVKTLLAIFFTKTVIRGGENLPRRGPYICVANHTSRWDGLVIGRLVDRPSTFMVHPNELKGLQGALLRKGGAFPANPKSDFAGFVTERFRCDEPFVIFPEGNVFYDGQTHPFKKGVARVAFNAATQQLDVPAVPVAIGYQWSRRRIVINIGAPVSVAEYRADYDHNPTGAMNSFCTALHREVLALRADLGFEADRKQLLKIKQGLHFLSGKDRAGSLSLST